MYNDIAWFVEAYRELQWPGRSPALRVTTWFRKWSQWSHGQWSGGRKFGLRVPLRASCAFRNLSSQMYENVRGDESDSDSFTVEDSLTYKDRTISLKEKAE